MPPSGVRDACEVSDAVLLDTANIAGGLTSSVSWAAMRLMGIRKSRNNIDSTEKPFAARV